MLPLIVAVAASRCARRGAPRRASCGRGAGRARARSVAFVLANPHALLSFHEFWADVRKQEEAASGFGKLGLDYDSGVVYYLWVLTWGLRLGAACGRGARRRGGVSATTCGAALFLVPWPVAVHRSTWDCRSRFFGRWLLPAFPALALLAAVARGAGPPIAVRAPARADGALAGARRRAGRHRASTTACTSTACSRATTPATSRASGWSRNIPAGSKVVVEPIVPDAWFADAGGRADARGGRARGPTRSGRRWIKFPTGRTTIDRAGTPRRGGKGRFVSSRTTSARSRPALVGAYARGGYCWVCRLDAVRARLRDPRRGAARDRLLPGARAPRRARARGHPVPSRPGPGGVQLRLELRLLPAGVRASGPDGGDLPAARAACRGA